MQILFLLNRRTLLSYLSGKNITYTNTLQNIGTVPANNTVFIDNIPEGTIFIKDSLSINNVIQPGANPEIA